MNRRTLCTLLFCAAAMTATTAVSLHAAAVDLKSTNAVIEKLHERMAARAAQLNKWKDAGAIGEEAKGTVALLPSAKLGLSERKEVRDLVVAENEDRLAFFRELVIVQVLNENELPNIGAAFARTKRVAAAPTHWLQEPLKQQWLQKKDLRE
jgi:uncharacterized protein YdbL (DUF1318 family)